MELLKYTIAVVVGGFITFLSSYLIEIRKAKNEKFKYGLDKMISVGEEYYKFSSYSLIYFTSLIDTLKKKEEFQSEGAHLILDQIDKNNELQLQKVRDNYLTITTAAVYFNVTSSELAVNQMLLMKEAQVKMSHAISLDNIDLYNDGYDEYTKVVKLIIKKIKEDQAVISSRIKALLE